GKGGNGGIGADGSIGGYSYGLLGFQTNHSIFNSITLEDISGGDKGLAGLGGTAGLNGLGLGMYLEEANNNSFSNSSIKNIISGSNDASYGLYSYQSHYNNWYNNSISTGISQNAYGTYLASSNSHIFKNNNLTSGPGFQGDDGGTDLYANGKTGGNTYGLYIENSIQNKFLNNSIISDNAGNGGNGGTGTYINGGDGGNSYGIYFLYSDLNSFHNNSICSGDAGNGGDGGTGMYSSGGNGGNSYGLYAEYSASNHFENNTLLSGEEGDAGAKGAGMYGSNGINGEDIGLIIMDESDSNIFFHNSVINDDSFAFDECVNQYHNGSNQGGNYWSGHSCVGNPSDGSYPYYIPGGANIDLYPFETDKGWMLNSLPQTSFTFEPNYPATFDIIFFNSTSYDSDGTIVNWSWNMGDGSLLYGEQVTHSYSNDGDYIVQLETTDNEGGINSSSKTISILNRPPVAEDDDYTTEEDTSIWIEVLLNDYDIDGYLKADTINVISGPSHANTTTNSTTGFIQYSPYSDFSGLDTFVYQISDDDGAVDTATVTVDVGEVNDPPIANDDSDSCDEDNLTWTNVITNDDDSDGFLDLSTLHVISPPIHGNTLINHSTGKIKYTPEPNWNGVDSYVYQIQDNDESSDTADVTITVYDINDPPIADFDVVPNNPMTNDMIYLNSTSNDIDGIIVNSTWIIEESTTLYGSNVIHEFSDDGVYSIELIILDDDGESASLEKTVSINNQPPIAQFSYNPINPRPNQSISFTDESTDLDGVISYVHWDFGDGTSSFQLNPNHTYVLSGTYLVTLTIMDDDNSSDSIQKQLTVDEGPIADFSWTPKYPSIGDNVYFYDNSESNESTIVNWTWDFDDGNISYEQNPVHIYKKFITYNNVTLTIRDDQSHTQSIAKKIISKNHYEEYILGNVTSCINLSDDHIQIWVNSTKGTNMIINHYSENPYQSPSIFSLLDNLYSIIVNDSHLIQWPIHIQIYYSQSDLSPRGLIESQLMGLCFWNESISQWQLFNDTGVNATYNGQGYDGYIWVDAWHLTNISIAADDIPPTQVTGLTVTDAKDGKLDIS
ncbi:MAG: tandem-95 repeat protein, partial [Chitinivibrionales bacterium]|nr:tandem-95 repeat protein [Chitinivibrionales bacterium]